MPLPAKPAPEYGVAEMSHKGGADGELPPGSASPCQHSSASVMVRQQNPAADDDIGRRNADAVDEEMLTQQARGASGGSTMLCVGKG